MKYLLITVQMYKTLCAFEAEFRRMVYFVAMNGNYMLIFCF